MSSFIRAAPHFLSTIAREKPHIREGEQGVSSLNSPGRSWASGRNVQETTQRFSCPKNLIVETSHRAQTPPSDSRSVGGRRFETEESALRPQWPNLEPRFVSL